MSEESPKKAQKDTHRSNTNLLHNSVWTSCYWAVVSLSAMVACAYDSGACNNNIYACLPMVIAYTHTKSVCDMVRALSYKII